MKGKLVAELSCKWYTFAILCGPAVLLRRNRKITSRNVPDNDLYSVIALAARGEVNLFRTERATSKAHCAIIVVLASAAAARRQAPNWSRALGSVGSSAMCIYQPARAYCITDGSSHLRVNDSHIFILCGKKIARSINWKALN